MNNQVLSQDKNLRLISTIRVSKQLKFVNIDIYKTVDTGYPDKLYLHFKVQGHTDFDLPTVFNYKSDGFSQVYNCGDIKEQPIHANPIIKADLGTFLNLAEPFRIEIV